MRPFTLCSVKDIKSASFFCTKGCGDVAACLRRRGKCGVCAAAPHPSFSFPGKKTGGVTVQKKGVCIASEQLEELQCLPIALPIARRCRVSTARRFAPAPTTRCCAAVGGSAALRMRHCCARRIDGTGGKRKLLRTPTRWAERHPQGACRIRKAAEPPTAAQQRMIEAEANRLATPNAATPRYG